MNVFFKIKNLDFIKNFIIIFDYNFLIVNRKVIAIILITFRENFNFFNNFLTFFILNFFSL